MKRMHLRKSLSVTALMGGMGLAANALADRAQGMSGPDCGMGPGMMMGGGQGEGGRLSRTDAPGSAIFTAHCASRHRKGGNIIAPSLPLAGSRKLADFKTFLDFIRHPQMPDGSQGAMPAFAQSDLSDRQAEILYRYLAAIDGAGKSGN